MLYGISVAARLVQRHAVAQEAAKVQLGSVLTAIEFLVANLRWIEALISPGQAFVARLAATPARANFRQLLRRPCQPPDEQRRRDRHQPHCSHTDRAAATPLHALEYKSGYCTVCASGRNSSTLISGRALERRKRKHQA